MTVEVSASNTKDALVFNCFGSPAILGAAIVAAPVDRRLCVPTFR